MCKVFKNHRLDNSHDSGGTSVDNCCQEKRRKSPKGNFVRVLVCLIVLLVLVWAYSKLVTIPVYRYYYQVEHLYSGQNRNPVQASLIVHDSRGFMLDSLPLYNYSDDDSLYYRHDYRFCTSTKEMITLQKDAGAHTKFKKDEKSIKDIIGDELYQELCRYCSENGLNVEDYNERGELFYFCNLNNAKMLHKQRSKITSRDSSIFIHGINDFALSSLKEVSKFRCLPQGTDTIKISKKWLKKHHYRNIQEGFALKLKMDDGVLGGIQCKPLNYFCGLMLKSIMLEDISQTYYDLSLCSKTISDIEINMRFYSAIDCKIQPLLSDDWDIGMNYIRLSYPYKCIPQSKSGTIHVAYNDMKNIQNIRLMILAALISIVLTFLITNSIKLMHQLKGKTLRKKAK